jgi:hypothetical protein
MEHLPECWYYDPAKTPAVAVNDGWPCICDRLRACEQRVREDERDNCWSAVAELVPTEFWANVPGLRDQWWIVKADALAAIDALKEKP